MNKYKIEVLETVKKQIDIEAINEKEALNIIKKMYMKEGDTAFKDNEICNLKAKIIEENGEIIGNFIDEKDNLDEQINQIKKILFEIKKSQEFVENKIELIKEFATESVNFLSEIDDHLSDFGTEYLMENV